MLSTSSKPCARRHPAAQITAGFAVALVALLAGAFAAPAAHAGDNEIPACSITTFLQWKACTREVADDYITARAVCTNISDEEEQDDCVDEAIESRMEENLLCKLQRNARKNLCALVGEEPYEPDFDPANFDDDFANPTNPNPYYPLLIGHQWSYETEDETNVVEVLDETKLIEGVTCAVVNDLVTAEDASEDTDDWIAQRLNGDIVYCGEEVKDYEFFAGDVPMLPELVETEGSFKAGRDGAKAGTLFPGVPVPGDTYRQEWAPGDAEDHTTILTTTYGYGNDPELDELVPQELAELLCNDDCVVTHDGTPLEPEASERKYLAPGIGIFLEVNETDEEINQLVGCNFDPVCDDLPAYDGEE